MLEKLDTKRVHEVSTQETSVKSVNLCGHDIAEEMEVTKNYTYKDYGRQLMILDCGMSNGVFGIECQTKNKFCELL